MNATLKKTKNPLATALRGLLDDSNLLTRKEWAKLLGITPPAVSLWVTGRTLPRADHMKAVWDFVSSSSGVPSAVIEEFKHVVSLPARRATPFHERLRGEPTLAHYMLRPLREAMLGTLAAVNPVAQEEIMYQTAELGRLFSAHDATVAEQFVQVPWMLKPGTRIGEFPELSELFKIHWKNIAVFGWNPRDATNGFFRRVAVNLLTRPTPHDFVLYYVLPHARFDEFLFQMKHVLGDLPHAAQEIAMKRVKLLEVSDEGIAKCIAGLLPDRSRAELLVALDLGEPTQCGYAWQDDVGIVLDRSDTIAIDRAVSYSTSNVLSFPGAKRSACAADLPPASLSIRSAS